MTVIPEAFRALLDAEEKAEAEKIERLSPLAKRTMEAFGLTVQEPEDLSAKTELVESALLVAEVINDLLEECSYDPSNA